MPEREMRTKNDLTKILKLIGAAQVAKDIEPMIATAKNIGMEYLGPR